MGTSGPMFDGRADKAAEHIVQETERSTAMLGAATVRATLNTSLKRQTPYYRTRVTYTKETPGHIIHDQGVIYGHWLEGTGSRNYPKTRFRGYASFRRSAQVIQRRAKEIALNTIARFIGRMN